MASVFFVDECEQFFETLRAEPFESANPSMVQPGVRITAAATTGQSISEGVICRPLVARGICGSFESMSTAGFFHLS